MLQPLWVTFSFIFIFICVMYSWLVSTPPLMNTSATIYEINDFSGITNNNELRLCACSWVTYKPIVSKTITVHNESSPTMPFLPLHNNPSNTQRPKGQRKCQPRFWGKRGMKKKQWSGKKKGNNWFSISRCDAEQV